MRQLVCRCARVLATDVVIICYMHQSYSDLYAILEGVLLVVVGATSSSFDVVIVEGSVVEVFTGGIIAVVLGIDVVISNVNIVAVYVPDVVIINTVVVWSWYDGPQRWKW